MLGKRLWRKLGAIDGFEEGPSIFGSTDADMAYFVDGKQVACERNGDLELRLTRKVIASRRAELKVDPRVELRGSSDWLTVLTTDPADDAFVLGLAQLAADAHLPAPGLPRRPPPEGADLARRRRFH